MQLLFLGTVHFIQLPTYWPYRIGAAGFRACFARARAARGPDPDGDAIRSWFHLTYSMRTGARSRLQHTQCTVQHICAIYDCLHFNTFRSIHRSFAPAPVALRCQRSRAYALALAFSLTFPPACDVIVRCTARLHRLGGVACVPAPCDRYGACECASECECVYELCTCMQAPQLGETKARSWVAYRSSAGVVVHVHTTARLVGLVPRPQSVRLCSNNGT